jgi:hypothetical protein
MDERGVLARQLEIFALDIRRDRYGALVVCQLLPSTRGAGAQSLQLDLHGLDLARQLDVLGVVGNHGNRRLR